VALRPNADHGLPNIVVCRSHTTTHHSQWNSSRRVSSPSQKADNTKHSKEKNIHNPAGLEPTISVGERPQPHALERVATGTGMSTNRSNRYQILMLPRYFSTDHPSVVWHLSQFQKIIFTFRSWQCLSYVYSHSVTTSVNTKSSVTSLPSNFRFGSKSRDRYSNKSFSYKITDFVDF
jgi:hypothetical protein